MPKIKLKPKIEKRLSQARINQMTLLFVGIFAISAVTYVGTNHNQASQAATIGGLYVTPPSSQVEPGTTVAVTVREQSGTDAVNAVQAALTYNAAQLQFVSITEGTAFPFKAAPDTATAGMVRLARGVNVGAAGVSGDNIVVTVNFKVLATSGTAAVQFNTDQSLIVRSSDNANILSTATGGS